MASKKLCIAGMEYFRFSFAYSLVQREILLLIRFMNRIILEVKSDLIVDVLNSFSDEILEKMLLFNKIKGEISESNSFNEGDIIPEDVKISKSDLQELIKVMDELSSFLNSEIDKILEEAYADVLECATKYANETKDGITKRKSFIIMLLTNMKQIIIDETKKAEF